ncbi:MAG TPA: DUF1080 domain-containing protein [Fodinibius sp.]|nr:DUF1080 domain-containing protein [Fodinibius sp.]
MEISARPTLLKKAVLFTIIGCLAVTASAFLWTGQRAEPDQQWISLFNGQNLDGWVPKFAGHELGVNYKNTFRVEEGLLTVSYDNWNSFDGEYGHLFYDKRSFSNYKIRAEYRFIGEQVEGGAGWAFRNNGLMLHCQSPESMPLHQEYPVSIEVQLLGGDGKNPRSTANLCTPGTNVVMDGELVTRHCTNSESETYHGDQWVSVEVEVRGDSLVSHSVNGNPVLHYTQPQYDERDSTAQRLIPDNGELLIDGGYISIQAESHPTQFRKIEILPLD